MTEGEEEAGSLWFGFDFGQRRSEKKSIGGGRDFSSPTFCFVKFPLKAITPDLTPQNM